MTSVEQRGCPVLSEIRGLAVVLGFEHRVPAAELTCSPLFRLNERPSGKCGPCSRNAPQKGSVVMTRKILMGFFVSLVSVSSGAQAMTLTHGASFVAFNAGQAQNVDYLTSGARTNMSGVQMLISPVTRGLVSSRDSRRSPSRASTSGCKPPTVPSSLCGRTAPLSQAQT